MRSWQRTTIAGRRLATKVFDLLYPWLDRWDHREADLRGSKKGGGGILRLLRGLRACDPNGREKTRLFGSALGVECDKNQRKKGNWGKRTGSRKGAWHGKSSGMFIDPLEAKVLLSAVIATDKLDYPFGATVQISGSGFTPNEVVQLQVLHAPGTAGSNADPQNQPWNVTADAAGAVTADWVVNDPDAVDASYDLTALGLLGGETAKAAFTDGETLTARQSGIWSDPNTWSATRVGTISNGAGSNAVTGVGTSFLSELAVGTVITDGSDNVLGTVASITDDTHLTVNAAIAGVHAGIAYKAHVTPGTGDSVTISGNFTVTADVDAQVAALNVSNTSASASASLLSFNSGIGLTVTGNVLIQGNASTHTGKIDLTGATLTVGGTFAIASNGTVTAGTGTLELAAAFTNSGTFTANSGTVEYNGTGAQTIAALNYNNLTISGARGGAAVALASGTIGLAGAFNPSATAVSYTSSGNMMNYNAAGAQTVAPFTYNLLTLAGGGTKTAGGAIRVNNNFTINAGVVFDAATFSHTFGSCGLTTAAP